MENDIVGIVGGMGTAATLELFSRIVKYTDAKSDKDHVNLLIMNDSEIPDRTKYILGKGENPLPYLKNNLQKMHYSNVKLVAIPCMTAHTFFPALERNSKVKLINAIKLIDIHLNEKQFPLNIEKIGLLATTGSVKSNVFRKYITKEIFLPTKKDQSILMDSIYGESGIKAGYISQENLNRILQIITNLKREGVQAIIAGCTEIGLILNSSNTGIPVIDPLTLLAKEIIRVGGKSIK